MRLKTKQETPSFEQVYLGRILSCRRVDVLRVSPSYNEKSQPVFLQLQINFSCPSSSSDDGNNGRLALAAVRKYTQSFPFAAVLPVQPLTYMPVNTSDGNSALRVTFLRKKTAEKGSADGGMLFSCHLLSGEDHRGRELDSDKTTIALSARRIIKGQTIAKIFSEKQIVLAFVKGLEERQGRDILAKNVNVTVASVFHLWM